ncbi:Uncharacterized protein TCM_000846 [Theobroma cacao]|uniref:Uncharacterized protein n=1 Tax=Theobroma cacao TaxID=3641 RepID=A0A061DHU1_THECC|nr:Uncharacterized protein TCM_000846 [Theobroma cacao]
MGWTQRGGLVKVKECLIKLNPKVREAEKGVGGVGLRAARMRPKDGDKTDRGEGEELERIGRGLIWSFTIPVLGNQQAAGQLL